MLRPPARSTLFPYTTLFRSLRDRLHRLDGAERLSLLQLHAHFGQLDVHDVAQLLLRSEEHTSELQSRENLVCRLLLEKKNTTSIRASSTRRVLSSTAAAAEP